MHLDGLNNFPNAIILFFVVAIFFNLTGLLNFEKL